MNEGSEPTNFLAQRLEARRLELGIPSFSALAERAGVSEASLRKLWAAGKRAPRSDTLAKVARALGIRLAELLESPDANHADGIAQNLLRKRLALGWSQERMAKFLGVAVSQVSRFESRKRHIRHKDLLKINERLESLGAAAGGGPKGGAEEVQFGAVVKAILATMPPAGSIWPEAQRQEWLQLLAQAMRSSYKNS